MPYPIEVIGCLLRRRTGEPEAVKDLLNHLRKVGVHNASTTLAELLEMTCQQLTSTQLRDFLLLAIHPGTDFTIDSADVLLGKPARDLVDTLCDRGLVAKDGARRRMYGSPVRMLTE